MDFVLADGSIWAVRKGDRDFEGAVVHLGALGVVARLTLNLQPAFAVYQTIYDYLPLSELEQGFDAVMGAAYSVSLFTTWTGPVIDQVWAKSLSPNPPELFGARAATEPRHPIRGMPADFCTSQLNEPGQWDERLAHFKMEFTPSSGEELQSEYFVPRESAWAALESIRDLADQIAPHLHISEVRAIKADNLWLSPAYEADVIGIHFTWKPHTADVMRLLPQIEGRLRQLRRPHWGKLFTWDRLAASYPRAQDFRALRQRLDPTGKFDNGYLQRVLS
jgi:xylitol oxidase